MKLRTSLIGALVGMCLAVALSFTVSQYITARDGYEKELRERLGLIAHLAALSIDGDLHKTLQNSEDEGNAAYLQIQAMLCEVRKRDPTIA